MKTSLVGRLVVLAHAFRTRRAWRLFSGILTVHSAFYAFAVQGAPTVYERAVADFDRAQLPAPTSADRIRRAGNLAGERGGCCLSGRVEYDFSIGEAGWYELTVVGRPLGVEFEVVPSDGAHHAVPTFRAYGGADAVVAGEDKIANVWLGARKYTVSLAHHFWTGFPSVERLRLKRTSGSPGTTAHATFGVPNPIFRPRRCEPLQVLAGGMPEPSGKLFALFHTSDGRRLAQTEIDLPASTAPRIRSVPVPCDVAGAYYVTFATDAGSVPSRDMRPAVYEVADVSASAAPAAKRELVQTIDLRALAPDYSSDRTRVATSAAGSYRESGATGFTKYQRSPTAARKLLPEPSWFAYSLRGIKPQTSYVVEVDYPDDARRSMVFSLREDRPLTYSVSAGVDSGNEFSISNAMQTHTLRFWARSDTVRLVVLNVHDGNRAAAAAIRVYREERTASTVEPASGRQYINWYEEGANFVSMVGMREEWWKPQTVTEAAQRWVRSAAESGFTMLAPTVAVYEFALYPSRFNRVFSRPDSDYLRRLLLAAEAHGVHVVPELHPRADELDWPFAASPDPKPNALISKSGQSNHFTPDGKSRNHPPHYHPLHPANQDWYVEMIGEMADRYSDSPAFAGVSLRLMDWANPSLNNFHSLDWGYDEATVRRFGAETGVPVPSFSEGASGARKRHAWLMGNARESWIHWRCMKVAEIFTRVRDRVRKARPDLRIYTTIFPFGDGERDRDQLREAGVDPELLSRIEGVLLVNAMTSYGRREPDPIATQRMRDRLIQPGRTSLIPGSRFLSPSWYIEGTEVVAPPEALGFRPGTRSTWMSVPVTPAGRHALERFAVLLADTDAQMLGDGGNAYAWGQPLQEEWIREFRAIPGARFEIRPDALDPVAVRTHAGADALQFYLVNRERYRVRVTITFSGTDAIARPTRSERVALVRQQLALELMPYELRYFTAPLGSRIVSIQTYPPDAERQRVSRQVAWVVKHAGPGGATHALSPEQRDALRRGATQAEDALAKGHLWRARVLLEDSNLLRAYGRLGAVPPELRDAVVAK